MQVKERPRTPGNTEDADNADQTRAEDRTGSKLFWRHAAKHDDEESRSQHHHLNERRDRKLRNLAGGFPCRAKARNGTHADRNKDADEENGHCAAGEGLLFELLFAFGYPSEPLVVTVGQTTLEFRIILELSAAPENGKCGHTDRKEEGRDGHRQNLPEGHALGRHDAHHSSHGRGHG